MKYALFGLTLLIATQSPSLERGPQMQIWHIRTFTAPLKMEGRVDVLKFQVGKVMVCKAIYTNRDREVVKENNADDDAISIGLALTSASLGDVPCE